MDEPIPQSAAFRIQLPTFEGPLDLLLHLIKKHELDVLELPIAFVTERYLDYLSVMQELDLDVASEYLLMAATLAHIKSKSLLPSAPSDAFEEQDEGYQEDPRAELIRRLLEYQKYKAAGEQLGARPLAGRDVFQRGMSAPEAQGPAPLAGIDLYKLLDAFQGILKRVHGRAALEVTAERITIHERISELSDLLSVRRSCTFEELFDSARTRYEVVVTFLALLEMTKLRITRIYQADPTAAIHVHYALLDADSPSVAPEADAVDASFTATPLTAADSAAVESAADPDLDSAFDSSISDADELAAAAHLHELGDSEELDTLETVDEEAWSSADDEVVVPDVLEAFAAQEDIAPSPVAFDESAKATEPEWHANLANAELDASGNSDSFTPQHEPEVSSAFSEPSERRAQVETAAALFESDAPVLDAEHVPVMDEEFALADTEVTGMAGLVARDPRAVLAEHTEHEAAEHSDEACHDAPPSAADAAASSQPEIEHPHPDLQSFDDEVTQQHAQHEHDESKP